MDIEYGDDTYKTASLSYSTSSSEVSDLTTPSLQALTEVISAVPLPKYPEPPRWRFVGEAKKTAGYSSKEAGTHIIRESSTNNYHDESNESGETMPCQQIINDKSTSSEGQAHDNDHDGSTNVSQENINKSGNNYWTDSSSDAHTNSENSNQVLDDEISSKGDICESNSISESKQKRRFLLLLIPILITVVIVGVVLGKNFIPNSNDEGVMVFATGSDGNVVNATDEPSSLPSVYPTSYDNNEQPTGLFGSPTYSWVDDTPDEPNNDYPWLQNDRAISLIPVGDLSTSPTTTQTTSLPTPRPTRRHYSGTRLPSVNPTPAGMEGLTTPPAGQDNSLSTTAKPTKRHFIGSPDPQPVDTTGSPTSSSPMSSYEELDVITDSPSKQPTSSTPRPFWTL